MGWKVAVLLCFACQGHAVSNVFTRNSISSSLNLISNSLRQLTSLLSGVEVPSTEYDIGDELPSENCDTLEPDDVADGSNQAPGWNFLQKRKQLSSPDNSFPSKIDDKLTSDAHGRMKWELLARHGEDRTSGDRRNKKWELIPHQRVEQMSNNKEMMVSKFDEKLLPEAMTTQIQANTGKTEDIVDHRRVVDTAKEDILQILHKELRKDLLAEDVKVIDWTGAKVEGSGPVKMLMKLLRRVNAKFVVKEDIQVELISHGRCQTSGGMLLMARCRFLFSSGKGLFLRFYHEDDPLHVALKTLIRFNDNGNIDLIFVDQSVVNRRRLVWPQLELYDGVATNLKKVLNWAQEENLFNVLLDDIPNIFRKEPRWEVFTEDFKVIDQTGVETKSNELKLLLRLLRKMHRKFAVKDHSKVELINHGRGSYACLPEPSLVVRWNIELGGMNRPFFWLWHIDDPLHIEATFALHINDKKKVDYMLLNECCLNGHEMIWPDLRLSDSIGKNLKRIEAWGRYVQDTRGSSR